MKVIFISLQFYLHFISSYSIEIQKEAANINLAAPLKMSTNNVAMYLKWFSQIDVRILLSERRIELVFCFSQSLYSKRIFLSDYSEKFEPFPLLYSNILL